MTQYTSIRLVIAISAMGWKLYQMDAKTTFLNDIVDTLLLGIRSMIKAEEYFPRSRKLHHEYTEEIRNVGLQVHSYSDGCKFEEAERFCFRFKFDLSHYESLIDWVLDVSDEHQTRYLFCCECSQSVHVRTKADSLDCCKTCAHIVLWQYTIHNRFQIVT